MYYLSIWKQGFRWNNLDFCFQPRWNNGDRIYSPIKINHNKRKNIETGVFKTLHRRQKGQRSLKERRSIKQKESSRDLQSVQQSHYRSLLISACMWEHCMKLQGPPERSGGRLFRAHRALGVDCVHTRAENW